MLGLECGGPAPLWPVSPYHSTASQALSPQDDFTPERPNAGQSAARPAHSKISSTYPNRAGRIIARFGVRRPGAALACFSLPLNCESSSFAPKTISRPRDRTRAKALPGQPGQRTPKLVAYILQIEPAPLWPVSPYHLTASQALSPQRRFHARETERGPKRCQASALQN